MFTERTSVGLDVDARSVAAAAIDSVTGELFQTFPCSARTWGVVADDEFSVDKFVDCDPIEYPKSMEGYGVLTDIG